MKNKDKYDLRNIEPILRKKTRNDYKPPYQYWEIKIYENGVKVKSIYLEHGYISELMAWLESETS